MQFKDWSSVLGTWVSIAAAILGGYFALDAYRADIAKRSDARVVQTFALFNQFQSGDMLRIRGDILQRGVASDQDVAAFVDFFDAVNVCVERSLCEDELVQQLFGPYAQGAYPRLETWIAETRAAEQRLGIVTPREAGHGLQVLAGRADTPPVAVSQDEPAPESR